MTAPVEAAHPSEQVRRAAEAHLRRLVGHPEAAFRDGQWEAVEALIARRRALVVQRTGWGKSAVYFVATALRRAEGAGPTVIVSPLLALMRDQVMAARSTFSFGLDAFDTWGALVGRLAGAVLFCSAAFVTSEPSPSSKADSLLIPAVGTFLASVAVVVWTEPLVVAARKPPSGPDFYFFTEVSDVENALGQLRIVLLGASALLVLVGGLAGWRVARLAGSLADTVDELTAARDRERRFVADVSHELRTPVTALVHEASELAAGLDALHPATRRVVELLESDVRRLRDLVEELLELSRLDAAGEAADLELGEVDVARLLDAILAKRLPTATVSVPAGLRVRTDRRRLERIVANLVDNARAHADGRSVTLRAHLDGSCLVVEVADASLPEDRTRKKTIYARASIPFYWIVNLPDRVIEVYSNPTGPTHLPDYQTRVTHHDREGGTLPPDHAA